MALFFFLLFFLTCIVFSQLCGNPAVWFSIILNMQRQSLFIWLFNTFKSLVDKVSFTSHQSNII
uniref:Uncharacterized protein n=1 Tax=Anguilla anguilla TaxID=7936 RepID=A0A0E9WZ89_ANGAN